MSNYAFDRKPYMPTTSSCLVGPRAESISMSCEQWFEVVGYMARPGRVSSFEAEIPKDGRDKVFENLFPGQVYRPIELGDTPSGLPNKLGAQFRINFASLDNCPAVLNDSIRAGNGGCVGRINKIELYEPMRIWLQKYLEDKYKGAHIVTVDSHARTLDVILEDYGMIDHYPQTVGLDIQIDVLGIIVKGGKSAIAFIEAKKTQLNLHDLGQLWAYCKLCDPAEAFLLSSAGIGSLNKILNNLSRTDLLDFGDGRKIKKMQVAKWDITSNSIDFRTLVPRI